MKADGEAAGEGIATRGGVRSLEAGRFGETCIF